MVKVEEEMISRKEQEQHSKTLSLITLELDLILEMAEDNLLLHN